MDWAGASGPVPGAHRGSHRRVPDYPPYGGQFAEVVPHLTVGGHGTAQQLGAAERDVRRHLPIREQAQAVTLMAEQTDGHWHRRSTFALGLTH